MKVPSLFWILFGIGLIIGLIDQFVMHGTAFELTSIAHSTWADGCAAGFMLSAWVTLFIKHVPER